MKHLFSLLFIFYFVLGNSQTTIPIVGFKGTINTFPTVSGDTITATITLLDISNQFTGNSLVGRDSLVLWRNCKRYRVDTIMTAFATSVTLKLLKEGNPNLTPGDCAFIEETVGNKSFAPAGITDGERQCINAYYVGSDSLGVTDSIYLQGDSLIVLKKGSGQVYKNRIHTGLFSAYDVANPQKYDIYVNTDQTSYWYDGTDWVLFDGDTNPYNEGELTLHDMDTNVVGMRSNTHYFNVKNFVGLNGIQISTNELDTINIGIDTTLFEAGETQYLNPYVITGDTVGFYLTVAVDTVLFENTIDTAAYCCPPSLSGDTLFIAENYVQLPKENLIGGWGITATESPDYTWNLIADSSQVATQYDLSLIGGNQTLSIDSTNRVFEISISGGNTVKFKDTGGIDSTTVVNGYGTTITESPANQFNITVDSSKFATVYDLSQVSGGASPFLLKLSSGDFGTSSTTIAEWTGSNFRDTIDISGWYKIEVYANFTSAATTTGIKFDITASGHGYASGFYSASINDVPDPAVRTTKNVSALGSDPITTTGVSSTSEEHTLYANVSCYMGSSTIVIPKFGSEVGGSTVTFKQYARLIITKLF